MAVDDLRETELAYRMASIDVSAMAMEMLTGKDLGRIAYLMGMDRADLEAKSDDGSFTAVELVALSYFCGYAIRTKDIMSDMMKTILNDSEGVS